MGTVREPVEAVGERHLDAARVGADRHTAEDLVGDGGHDGLVVAAHDDLRVGPPRLEQHEGVVDLGEDATVVVRLHRADDDGALGQDRVGGVPRELAHDDVAVIALEQRAEVEQAAELGVVLEREGGLPDVTCGEVHRGCSERSGCPRPAGTTAVRATAVVALCGPCGLLRSVRAGRLCHPTRASVDRFRGHGGERRAVARGADQLTGGDGCDDPASVGGERLAAGDPGERATLTGADRRTMTFYRQL